MQLRIWEVTVEEIVQYEARYPAAIITLNNPGTRNALSIPMIAALTAAFGRAESDPGVRAIIFTGAGPAFSAGMDLKELREALDSLKFDHGGAVWESALRGEQLIDRLFKSSKPTIAAVNGAAAAGGAGLLSVCDMVVAVPEARIGYPEMKVGVQAGMVLLHLMRLVGERQARYLILTGDLISASQAKEIGLINEVVAKPALIPTALRWANSVAMNGPKAEVISKSLLREFSAQAMAMTTSEYAAPPHLTDECRAGLAAFFAKQRSPWAPKSEPI
jgi:methylglutaconyl-CoA hydratase